MWRTLRTFDTPEQAQALVKHLTAQHQQQRPFFPTMPLAQYRAVGREYQMHERPAPRPEPVDPVLRELAAARLREAS